MIKCIKQCFALAYHVSLCLIFLKHNQQKLKIVMQKTD